MMEQLFYYVERKKMELLGFKFNNSIEKVLAENYTNTLKKRNL